MATQVQGEAFPSAMLATGHIVGGTAAPAIAAGAGAGTSPTIAISGNDIAGEITLTTGAAPGTSGIVATITFNVAYTVAPFVVIEAGNAATALLAAGAIVFVGSRSTTTFTLDVGATGLVTLTAYKWSYHVIQ